MGTESPLIIIGSGLAGLLTACLVAEKKPVILVTKSTLFDSNTQWSQGGIAAVWGPKDSVDLHQQDTLSAGHGLCDERAVKVLSSKSRDAIQQLMDLGVSFDTDAQKKILLGLEGAHSTHRILHAGGDATGNEIQRVLVERALEHLNITIHEHTLVTEIATEENRVTGVHCLETQQGTASFIASHQVVLATGGAGQLFQYTSNPPEATGEGVLLAYQAGAELMDLEFYQFHPTALCLPNAPNFLITEALRGEGAILRNSAGTPFMESLHSKKDLAPRDIVSRAIFQQQSGQQSVYLDATQLNREQLPQRFPTIFQRCLEYGVDIRKDWIPITPVAHYMIGGVVTNLWGKTTVHGLLACGEVARTGVHGANRLASNSLLEATVFAIRVASVACQPQETPSSQISQPATESTRTALPLSRDDLQKLMWEKVGMRRCEAGLAEAVSSLQQTVFCRENTREALELRCMTLLGSLVAQSALQRRESRGAHFRSDFQTSDHSINPISVNRNNLL